MGADFTMPKGVSQRPDGRYMARFQYNGEKYCLYDNDIDKLLERISDLKYEVRHGVYSKESNITVDKWFEKWIEEYKLNIVKETTVTRYKSAYYMHIKDYMGKKKMRDIRPEHIQKLYNSLAQNGNLAVVVTVLSGMFSQAYKSQLINKNPVPMTTIPRKKKEKRERRVLTLEEQNLLLKYASGMIRDLIEVTLSTGLRTGELRGLEWDDIDFENKIIHVTGTLTDINGRIFKETPKTLTSRRDIPMLENVERILLKKRDEKPKTGKNMYDGELTNLVFKSQRNGPISNPRFVRMLNRVVERINEDGIEFEHMYPHSLRHTFATRCIENGVTPQVLKAILGHSSLAMTMDLYAHVLPGTKADEMKKIANLFE